MRGLRVVQHPVDAEPRQRFGQVLEQPSSAAEEHRRERDLQFIQNAEVQVLLDHFGTARDADVAASGGLSRAGKCGLRPVVDEVEDRPAWPWPGRAPLMCQNEDRGVEWCILGPCAA